METIFQSSGVQSLAEGGGDVEARDLECFVNRCKRRGVPDDGKRPFIEPGASGGGSDVIIRQGASGIDREADHRVPLLSFREGLRRIGPAAFDLPANLKDIGFIGTARVLQRNRILTIHPGGGGADGRYRPLADGRCRRLDILRHFQFDVHHLFGPRAAPHIDTGRERDDERMARKRSQYEKNEEFFGHDAGKPPSFTRRQ